MRVGEGFTVENHSGICNLFFLNHNDANDVYQFLLWNVGEFFICFMQI